MEVSNLLMLSLLYEALQGGYTESVGCLENYEPRLFRAYEKKQFDKIQNYLIDFKKQKNISESLANRISASFALRYLIINSFKNAEIMYGKKLGNNFLLALDFSKTEIKPTLSGNVFNIIFKNAKFSFENQNNESVFKNAKAKKFLRSQTTIDNKIHLKVLTEVLSNNIKMEIVVNLECDDITIEHNDGIKPSVCEILEGQVY